MSIAHTHTHASTHKLAPEEVQCLIHLSLTTERLRGYLTFLVIYALSYFVFVFCFLISCCGTRLKGLSCRQRESAHVVLGAVPAYTAMSDHGDIAGVRRHQKTSQPALYCLCSEVQVNIRSLLIGKVSNNLQVALYWQIYWQCL